MELISFDEALSRAPVTRRTLRRWLADQVLTRHPSAVCEWQGVTRLRAMVDLDELVRVLSDRPPRRVRPTVGEQNRSRTPSAPIS